MDVAGLKTAIRRICRVRDGLRISGRVCSDSRQVRAGDVFVAVKGVHVDGHDFIKQAVDRGAALIVSQQEASEDVPAVVVPDSAKVLGEFAQAAAGWPTQELVTLGVTGTNGKTTVAYLVRAMLGAVGLGCGMIGTVEYDVGGDKMLAADNTTPDAVRLADMMRQMLDNGLKAVVLECSSHALDQQRTAGVAFDAAAFTNLSGDHLDYHGTRENYRAAKGKLFAGLADESVAVVNAQDEAGKYMAQQVAGRLWWYGLDIDADISAHVKSKGLWGCELELTVFGERLPVRLDLLGEHNVSNFLAAVGLVTAAGMDTADIAEAIKSVTGAPGRLEKIECGQNFTVLVDYAHTDDALKHSLETIRELTCGRLILVFGCGGERDRSKRPRMAAVAQKLADKIILTHDNPRGEDPEQILADIRAGFSVAGMAKMVAQPDRREAIAAAVNIAKAGDVVLIAGKGHENYQLVGDKRLHFDDREVAMEVLS